MRRPKTTGWKSDTQEGNTMKKSILLPASAAAMLGCLGLMRAQNPGQPQIQRSIQIIQAGDGTTSVNTTGMNAAGISSAGPANNFQFIAGSLIGGVPVKGAPYAAQAVTESVQAMADGNRIVQKSTSQIYRDSQGRERREQSLAGIGPFSSGTEPLQTIFITDPVSNVNYSLEPKNKVAVKIPVPPAPALPPAPPTPPGLGSSSDGPQEASIRQFNVVTPPLPPMPPPPGLQGAPEMVTIGPQVVILQSGNAPTPSVEQLGNKVIEGVPVTGTRTKITIPAGQVGNEKAIEITDERWYSNDLQVTVYSEHNDPRMGKTTYSLKNIARNEPDAKLFQVPADYTLKDAKLDLRIERKPAQ
jgi:hypothetical protein